MQLELVPFSGDRSDSRPTLTADEVKIAEAILQRHPDVVTAISEFAVAAVGMVGAFRKVCVEMRKAAIHGEEVRMVLGRAGWVKSRISEAKRLIEADEKTFKRFAAMEIGIHLALQEVRNTLPPGGPNGMGHFTKQQGEKVAEFFSSFGPLKKRAKFVYKGVGGVWAVSYRPVKQKPVKAK